jgi:hypothetical protein
LAYAGLGLDRPAGVRCIYYVCITNTLYMKSPEHVDSMILS